MSCDLRITQVQVRFVETGTEGLIGWAECIVMDAIRLNHIAIRRGADGVLFLTFPKKKLRNTSSNYFNPVSIDATAELRDAILANILPSIQVVEPSGK